MQHFNPEDIRRIIDMRGAIDAMRDGFMALSAGKANVPVRGVTATDGGTMLSMPAYIEGAPYATVKVVTVAPNNPTQGLPVVLGIVVVFDGKTGVPVATLDGATVTAIRTGAGGGLGAELLSRPESSVLAIIGAGVQARTQVEAVCTVRPITEIRVCSRSNSSAETFAAELREQYDAAVTVVATPSAAAQGADIVVAATNSSTPVVHLADLKPGVHVTGVGSFQATMQEVAADVVTTASVFVDHHESAWEEAGDLIIPRDAGQFNEAQVKAEIGEVAAGIKPGRTSAEEITFFKSVGNAVQDAAFAGRVVELATAGHP